MERISNGAHTCSAFAESLRGLLGLFTRLINQHMRFKINSCGFLYIIFARSYYGISEKVDFV